MQTLDVDGVTHRPADLENGRPVCLAKNAVAAGVQCVIRGMTEARSRDFLAQLREEDYSRRVF